MNDVCPSPNRWQLHIHLLTLRESRDSPGSHMSHQKMVLRQRCSLKWQLKSPVFLNSWSLTSILSLPAGSIPGASQISSPVGSLHAIIKSSELLRIPDTATMAGPSYGQFSHLMHWRDKNPCCRTCRLVSSRWWNLFIAVWGMACTKNAFSFLLWQLLGKSKTVPEVELSILQIYSLWRWGGKKRRNHGKSFSEASDMWFLKRHSNISQVSRPAWVICRNGSDSSNHLGGSQR